VADVTRRSGHLLALAGILVLGLVLYTRLGAAVEVPRVHPDELRYALAGSSLADGEGVRNRGVESGFGPVHAAFLASVLLVAGDRESAYPIWKAMNAFVFVLSAIPIYVLARRLLPPWWSLTSAALCLAIPSSIYVSIVMTESLAFLLVTSTMLAIVAAVEHPSTLRQLAVFSLIGLATATRSQFAVLFLAYLVSLGTVSWLKPSRTSLAREIRRLWPTAAAIAIGVAAVLARGLVSGTSNLLGPYSALWTDYDPLDVARWIVYHTADLELYLGVVPFVVAPIALWRLAQRGEAGDAVAASFAVCFLTLNAAFLLVVGAFSSEPFSFDRLHDRYLFYVVPLWLILFVVWLADGLPRPRTALGVGASAALILPVILPFRQLANEAGVDTVPGALWVWVESQTTGPGLASARLALLVFTVALIAVATFLPRRFAVALPVAVLMVFVVTSILAWNRMIDAPEDAVYAGHLERDWIDDLVPGDAEVTKLYVASPQCGTSTVAWHALILTEFFNDKVGRAAYIGDSFPDGIHPLDRVDLDSGALMLTSGKPLVSDYVYTQRGIELNGDQIASGTNAGLILWRVGGAVEVTNASTNNDVRTAECA
jgi:hypothetical protein